MKYLLLTQHHRLIKTLNSNNDGSNYKEFVYSLEKLFSLIWINSPDSLEGFGIIDLLKVSLNKDDVKEFYRISDVMEKHIKRLKLEEKDITREDIYLYATSQELERLDSEEDLNSRERDRLFQRIKKEKMKAENNRKRIKRAEKKIEKECKRKWQIIFGIFDLFIYLIPALIIFFLSQSLFSLIYISLIFVLFILTLSWCTRSKIFKNWFKEKKKQKNKYLCY